MTPITQMTFLPLCSWYSPDSWFPKKRTDHQCVAAASLRQEAKAVEPPPWPKTCLAKHAAAAQQSNVNRSLTADRSLAI
jgi:hypothetical protein